MATTSTSTSLVQAQYSSLDFNTISDDLRAQLQVNFANTYNDFTTSALGIMLIDEVAYGLDQLSFYLDRRATDNYLQTAITTKSVARLTRQLGYKMGASVACSVDVNVSLPTTYPFNAPIPAGFQIQGPNGLVFQTGQTLTIDSGDTSIHSIPCYQGQTFGETFVSDGTANQVFTLTRVPSGMYVASGTVVVYVNGTQYTEVQFINFDVMNEFEVGYNDSPTTIRFGDGAAGNIPPINATIAVTYVACAGANGQVTANTITSTVSPLVVNFQTLTLSVTNPTGSVGGSDPETLEHAKSFAGKVFKTRMVAVTQEDYDTLAGSYADSLYGRVALAQALSTRSASQDLALIDQINNITSEINAPANYAGSPTEATTTIAPASNNLSLPQPVINVATTTGFTPPGTIKVTTGAGVQSVAFTGTSGGNQFIGCTGGTGVMTTGGLVTGPTVDGVYVSDLRMRMVTITEETSGITTDLNTVASKNSTLNSNMNTILTSGRTVKSQLMEIVSDATDSSTDATAAQTSITAMPTSGANNLTTATASFLTSQISTSLTDPTNGINAIVTGGSNVLTTTTKSFLQGQLNSALYDPTNGISVIPSASGSQLTSADRTALLGYMSDIISKTADIVTQGSSAQSAITNQIIATANSAVTTLAGIGLTPTAVDSTLLSLTTENQAIVTQVGDTSSFAVPPLVVVQKNPVTLTYQTYTYPIPGLTMVSDVAAIQGSIVDQTTAVTAATDAIYNHVDSLLASDCKSNLVTVPILSVDASGFYAAPSNGLIHSLQSYLDSIKEVTQTVQVVSGAGFLVPAQVLVHVSYYAGYTQNTVLTAVTAAVNNVLRARKFGQSLYASELWEAIDAVPGVAFTNVTIEGSWTSTTDQTLTTQHLDTYGNLVISNGYVITKGSVKVGSPTLVTS